MKFLRRIVYLALFAPMLALAQEPNVDFSWFKDTFGTITTFISSVLVPFIFALAFIVFIWGVFKTFVLGGADPEKQAEGKQLMIYAIVGLAVMVGVCGFVNIVTGLFGVTGTESVPLPKIPF